MQENQKDALKNLLSPFSTETFLQDYFEKKFLHVERRDKNFYSWLTDLSSIDAILSDRVFRFPSLRLTKNGEEISSDVYSNDKFIDMTAVNKKFNEGFTIILNALHEQDGKLGELNRSLSQQLGHPFQMNVYITPPNSMGFPPHYDTHDVFILQVHGEKKWRVYEDESISLPTKMMEFQSNQHRPGKDFKEIQLSQGDLLYLPRGVFHDAETSTNLSVHITLGMLFYTWTDLLVQLVLDQSKKNIELRKSIPLLYEKQTNTADWMNEWDSMIAGIFTQNDAQTSIDAFRNNLLNNLHIPIPGLLQQREMIENTSLDQSFRLHPDKCCQIRKKKDEILLEWNNVQWTFPDYAENTLRTIIAKPTFQMSDLPEDLDRESLWILLKRLIKEGIVLMDAEKKNAIN